MSRLEVKEVETSKSKIRQPPDAEHENIPALGSGSIVCGRTGSGKSVLLSNLLQRYKGYVKRYVLISPTAKIDDIAKSFNVKAEDRIEDLKEAVDFLQALMDEQAGKLEKRDNDKVDQIIVILDDVVGDSHFLNSPQFTRIFVGGRHFNLTTFLATQSWTAIPRKVRLQAVNIFMFAASNSEVGILYEEFAPPGVERKRFTKMFLWATKEAYSFLYINLRSKHPWRKTLKTRFAL